MTQDFPVNPVLLAELRKAEEALNRASTTVDIIRETITKVALAECNVIVGKSVLRDLNTSVEYRVTGTRIDRDGVLWLQTRVYGSSGGEVYEIASLGNRYMHRYVTS